MRPSLFIAIGACLLAGCSALPERDGDQPAPVNVPATEIIQASQLTSHINALRTVVQASPAEQAEVMASARAGYEQAQAGPAALRYGLLLAAPAHPAHDPELAQRVLREALAQDQLLSAPERALGAIELQRVDAELRYAAEISRLVAEAQQQRDRQQAAPPNTAALTRRLQTAEEDNARLRKALDEALRRLEAIADIEQRGLEPSATTEGRRP